MQNQFNAVLKNNSLFKNTNISNISLDDLDLNIKFLEEGEVLFKSGDSASSIFLVIEGEVNLLRKRSFSKTTTAIVSPNEFFGQEEFFNKGNRHSTALAIRDSKLVELTSDNLDSLLVQYNSIFNNIKENLEDVDETIIQNLEQLLKEKIKSEQPKASIFDLEVDSKEKLKSLNESKKNEEEIQKLNGKIERYNELMSLGEKYEFKSLPSITIERFSSIS